MQAQHLLFHNHNIHPPRPPTLPPRSPLQLPNSALRQPRNRTFPSLSGRKWRNCAVSASLSPLDLTEDNIIQVLSDAKTELAQLFDTSVGITGKAELADLDGPYVKIRLSGKFWHQRSLVVARLGNYLKQRIPWDNMKKSCESSSDLCSFDDESLEMFFPQEILEVDIEDEKQLDDSPANF